MKRRAETLGREAEQAVAKIWRRRGFEILAERLRTGAGEIDLVAADAQTLVFIEVKARRNLNDAAYAVMPRQQSRLLGAAEAALAEHLDWHRPETRFDVALVAGRNIALIEDAIRLN